MRLWHLYLLAGLLALAELWSGPVAIDVGAALRATWEGRDSVDRIIVVDIRLPRLLLALLVGGALALSGAALQGLLRNPLASPDILGVSASAGLLAVLTLYFGLALAAWFVLPAAALAGAALAMLLLLRLTHRLPDTLALILSGIALTAGASALTTLALNYAPNPYALQEVYFWMLGSVANRSLADVALVLPFIVGGCLLLLRCGPCLDALTLGEEGAAALGFPLAQYRWQLIVGVACAVGGAVAVSGSIGFVGLLVPHLLRRAAGAVPSRLLHWSLPGGAVLVLLADLGVQQLAGARELPLGVLTALLGAPFFVGLLLRRESP
jgi:iron complex transport system permease protein